MYIHVSVYIEVFTSTLNVTYYYVPYYLFSSVGLCLTLCLTLHGLQDARLPCPYQIPELAQTHVHRVGDTIQPILSSVIPFSCLHSFPASGSFPVSQFFLSGGQSIGASASASVLPVNIQD